MKKKLKKGLYWSEFHRQFYHYDGKTLEKSWQTLNGGFRASGWTKSDYYLSEFLSFSPVWIGTF